MTSLFAFRAARRALDGPPRRACRSPPPCLPVSCLSWRLVADDLAQPTHRNPFLRRHLARPPRTRWAALRRQSLGL